MSIFKRKRNRKAKVVENYSLQKLKTKKASVKKKDQPHASFAKKKKDSEEDFYDR